MEGKILITGGAGYIGSHLAKNLLKEGFSIVLIDNLSTGHIRAIELLKKHYGNFEFIKADLNNRSELEKIFYQIPIETVIHLAAKIDANESLQKPDLYHQENYVNSVNLIDTMTACGINKLIFSSTAAVYGNPKYLPIDENHPTNPTNPYGQTKLDFEKYLEKITNLQYVILRYFNVGGSDPEGFLGKSHLESQDLLENVLKVVLGQKETLQIFGSDYQTSDGTPVRDFIHVEDITLGHILALENIGKYSGEVFNLGSETGFSVKEVVDKASLISGKEIPIEIVNKRPGDITSSVASAKKAKESLGWQSKYSDLETIIRSDLNWRMDHLLGYN